MANNIITRLLFLGPYDRVEKLVRAGIHFFHDLGKCLPRIFRVIFLAARRGDSWYVRHSIFSEHISWVTVARCQRTNLRALVCRELAFVDERDPSILRSPDFAPVRDQHVVNMPPMV